MVQMVWLTVLTTVEFSMILVRLQTYYDFI